jgi:F-box-like
MVCHDSASNPRQISWAINARFSPIFRLPLELLTEIFFICVFEVGWLDSDQSRYRPPMLFGMVCSAWRELAWSTPKLWNSVQLNLDNAPDSVPSLVKGWLDRSGKLPLSIFAIRENNSPNPNVLAVMDIIARHSERWEYIIFQLPSFCYDALKCVQNRLPHLQHLSVNNLPSIDLMETFNVAPELQTVGIRGPFVHTITLPTNQLTVLTIECASVDECLAVLRDCPRVTDCSFFGLGYFRLATYTSAPLLESLELEFVDHFAQEVGRVFDCLEIPAVRWLYCQASGHTFPDSNFISLISRSSCSLRTLFLADFIFEDDAFIECLRAVPSLHRLSLHRVYTGVATATFWMLDPFNTPIVGLSDYLLPNLKEFELVDYGPLSFPALLSFLRSRRGHGNGTLTKLLSAESSGVISQLQLVKVEVEEAQVLDGHALVGLRQLVEEGMKIELVTAGRNWL